MINYKTTNWWDVVQPNSFDIIYDCVGQSGTGDRAMTALRTGGHYVTLRGALASHPRADVTQTAFTNSVDNLYNFELLDELKHIVEAGGLRMRHIEEVFTLPHVADAFAGACRKRKQQQKKKQRITHGVNYRDKLGPGRIAS